MLVGVSATPAEAATGCDDGSADTTWRGPETEGGSVSWADDANWSNGVPTAESVVCIPYAAGSGPHVLEGTQAQAEMLALEGTLTVDTSLDVTSLAGEYGELHGPGTITVTDSITGAVLRILGKAVVDLPHDGATLGGEINVWDGSRLNVLGDAVLAPGAEIESFAGPTGPGLLTIAESGTLTFDSADGSAKVYGGFANHGQVNVTAGELWMSGTSPDDALPDQFSTGTFTGAAGTTLVVSSTELRGAARLDGVTWVDSISVPGGNTVTVADSTLVNWDGNETGLSTITGEGQIRLTDGTISDARVGGSLTLRIPAGEVADVRGTVQDRARVQVDGEMAHSGTVLVEDDAVLEVHGVLKGVNDGVHQGGMVESLDTDPGLVIIQPEGKLLADDRSFLGMYASAVNHGSVDSGSGFIVFAPLVESPEPSSGTFHAGPAGDLYLGDGWASTPELVLDQAATEGTVTVAGRVRSNRLEVSGALETWPSAEGHEGGHLNLGGTTTLHDGASIAGDVRVSGELEADLGAGGTASLSGAAVTGQVHVTSGTLSVPSLAPSTLGEDGTLTSGEWVASFGATLDLPTVNTIDTELRLLDPGSSFGDGLAALHGIGPNGTLLTGGDDLAVPGRFRNEGVLSLAPGSRLDVAGKFRQLATGTLVTWLDAAGRGTVRAAGPRELAGELRVERFKGYKPPRGTVLNFLTSDGREGVGEFDRVVSPPFGANDMRKFRVDYGRDHVRLWVDGLG
jgi:hypothetical protein